jgi:LCP family protein required for cell wall assembly
MDNFRRRIRGNQPKAVDGIVGRAHPRQVQHEVRDTRPFQIDGFRPNTSKLDDFRRPEGLHTQGTVRTTGPAQSFIPSKKEELRRQESLLHMSLPNKMPTETKKAKRLSKSGRRSGWRTFRRWSLRTGLALVALTLIVGGFLLFKGILKVNKVFKGGGVAPALASDLRPELLKGEGDGRVNILLMGKGGTGHAGADLTDTIIVASIDPINKTTTLVSIPRDLWVSTQGRGYSKINAVYANAKSRALYKDPKDKEKAEREGIDAVQEVVSQVLGIPLHYYGMVDFDGFKQAVDIVGGVDITVPKELAVTETLWDEASRKMYKLDVPAGLQHFDSMRALYFTRSRHTSLRGDFDRAERQRLFIQALSQKILSAGTYTNPLKISQLMSALGDHISTDLSINNALRIMQIGKSINLADMKSIGLADPPNNYVRTDNVDGQSVVRPTAGFGDYSAIQNYIRNTLKDPYLAKENAVLSVLNGTDTSGLATKQADLLKSYGYNVTVVADAPTHDYTTTILVDMTGGKKPFTRNYLEKRLGLKAVTKLPDSTIQATGVDFVIILGQN